MPRTGQSWDTLAAAYHANVITPFDPAVDFRLERDLRGFLRRWRRDGTLAKRVVADFGCGVGETLERVAGRAGFVIGLDLSEAMLDQSHRRLVRAGVATQRLGRRAGLRGVLAQMRAHRSGRCDGPQTVLVRGDLRRLEPLRGRVDLALAINSICPPTAAQAGRMIAGIAASLRPNGTAILVLPSLDSLAYLHELFRRHHGAPPPGESIEPRAGIYVAATGERQKYFTPEAMSRDPERVLRFRRKARALAALTHVNIGAIYGSRKSATCGSSCSS